MVNNLNQLILPMFFSGRPLVTPPPVPPGKRKFKHTWEFLEHEYTLSQEERMRENPLGLHFQVAITRLDGFNYRSVTRATQGKDFEVQFFEFHSGGCRLPNIVGGTHTVNLLLVAGGQYAPVDFIAYNDRYWFLVEVKDQQYGVDHGFVAFRNKNEVDSMLNPLALLRKQPAKTQLMLQPLQVLPSIVIKREAVIEKTHDWLNKCGVYSVVSPSF